MFLLYVYNLRRIQPFGAQFLNLIENLQKTTSTIVFNSEMECFSPKTGNKSRMSVLITGLSSILLEVLPSAVRQEKEIKRHIGHEGRNKIFCIYRCHDWLCRKPSTDRFLEIICVLRGHRCQLDTQKSVALLHTTENVFSLLKD